MLIDTRCFQIRAELMMFGAPIKEVRLMKRKDTGENLHDNRLAISARCESAWLTQAPVIHSPNFQQHSF